MTQPNFRDVELLSAYLDGQLSQAETTRLETRLKSDPQLRAVFDDLSQPRALLRQLPARRAPRNFTLTPKMAGLKPPIPRAFPLFRFASALAAILFVFSFAVNLTVPAFSAMRAAAPMPAAFGKGGGGGADPTMEAAQLNQSEAASQAPAATEAPALIAPAAPMPTASAQDSAAITLTPEAPRTMAVMATPTPEAAAGTAPSGEAQNQVSPTLPNQPITPRDVQNAPQEMQRPPIPISIVIGLLVLAVLAGIAAFFIRWQAERKFSQAVKKK
jgi:anti-sigma factor RsiW